MRLTQRGGLGIWIALFATQTIAEAQVIPVSFLDLVGTADSIVVAEAIDSRPEWVVTGQSRVIVTRVTFRVTKTLKGTERLLLPLEFLGGTVGNVRQEVSGVPTFDSGDRAVLFVTGTRAASPIVGHSQGRFPINIAPDGTEYVTLSDKRAFSSVNQIGSPITVSSVAIPTMTLSTFQRRIEDVVNLR